MPDIKSILRALTGKKPKEAERILGQHIMSPLVGNENLTPDELAYIGINPMENTQDVMPVSSVSSAHGYMYLQSRHLFDLLDEMVDRDTVIGGCLELIIAYMLMRPQGLTLKEEDADKPGAAEAIDAVQRLLIDGSNWSYMLWSLTDGLLRHGRSTLEITWHATPEGYLTPRKFYHCHPGQFTFDRDGKMFLATSTDGVYQPLPPLKFVTAARPALYDNPWGASLIYPLRFVYHFKKKAMIFRLRYADKNGEPIYIGKVIGDAPVATNPEISQQKLVEGLSSIGNNNFLVLGTGEDVQVINRPAGSGGGSLHREIGEDYDNYITTRLLGATLTTGTAINGNRALGEIHDKTMLNRILPPSRLLCEAINDMIIKPWCELNLPPGAPHPYYYIDTEESTDAADARATLETAVRVGLKVAAAEARERLGFREPVDEEETIGGAGFTPLARKETSVPTPVAEPEQVDASANAVNPAEGRPSRSFNPSTRATPSFTEETTANATQMASGEREYGCVMLPLEDDHAAEAEAWTRANVAEEDLAEEGIVTDPHITLLYGITDDDPQHVNRALLGAYPAWVGYGQLKLFRNDEADVLYVEVDDYFGDLQAIRSELVNGVPRDPEVDSSKGEYIPHLTLAYLKPGRGSKYIAAGGGDGHPTDAPVYGPLVHELGVLDKALFSTTDRAVSYTFRLTGPLVYMGTDDSKVSLKQALEDATPPASAGSPNDYLSPTGAALRRCISLTRQSGHEEEVAARMNALLSIYSPDSSQYASLYWAAARHAQLCDHFHAAQVRSQATVSVMSAVLAGGSQSLVEKWHDDMEISDAEVARAEAELAAMTERQEEMGRILSAETSGALFTMMNNTARNIDAMWADNDAPLSTLAYNAIDIDAIDAAADEAALITTYGTFLMALGYTANTIEAAVAAKEGRAPEFWNSDGTGDNEAAVFADGFTFEGWATAYGAAADWMISRGVLTLQQVRYIAGLMAEQTGGERDAIERDLRDHYFALARTVDINATKRVQTMIAQAVGRGETVGQFLEKIDEQLGIGEVPGGLDSYWENVWRTEVANAFSQQQQQQEADPDYQDVLWGHLGGNPNDARSEPSHARFNGVRFKKGSQATQALGRPPFRYRCRCYMTPIVDPDPENSTHKESPNALTVAATITRF